MEYFFKRLEAYIEVRPTAAMTDIIVKIMVEVLSILGIMTKEIGRGRMSKSLPVIIYLQKLTFCREISQEADRKEGYRGCASKTGSTDARGSSYGSSGSLEGYSRD